MALVMTTSSVLEEIDDERGEFGISSNFDDDEYEEMLGYSSSKNGANGGTRYSQRRRGKEWRWCTAFVSIIFLGSTYVFLGRNGLNEADFPNRNRESASTPQFSCPADTALKIPKNYDESFVEDYENATKAMTSNMTEFLANLHQTTFDAWGRTYDEVKASLYDWKAKQYAPYLQDGSTIFESAAGIGLNLYMTLEILYEAKGIKNLRVYGNEYEAVSAKKANQVFDEIPPAGATKGVICAADSTDISFVPANDFDVVFTGYLRYVRSNEHNCKVFYW